MPKQAEFKNACHKIAKSLCLLSIKRGMPKPKKLRDRPIPLQFGFRMLIFHTPNAQNQRSGTLNPHFSQSFYYGEIL